MRLTGPKQRSEATLLRVRVESRVSLLVARYARLRLELPLQLIQEPPVRTLGDDLLRAGLDQPYLV